MENEDINTTLGNIRVQLNNNKQERMVLQARHAELIKNNESDKIEKLKVIGERMKNLQEMNDILNTKIKTMIDFINAQYQVRNLMI